MVPRRVTFSPGLPPASFLLYITPFMWQTACMQAGKFANCVGYFHESFDFNLVRKQPNIRIPWQGRTIFRRLWAICKNPRWSPLQCMKSSEGDVMGLGSMTLVNVYWESILAWLSPCVTLVLLHVISVPGFKLKQNVSLFLGSTLPIKII